LYSKHCKITNNILQNKNAADILGIVTLKTNSSHSYYFTGIDSIFHTVFFCFLKLHKTVYKIANRICN